MRQGRAVADMMMYTGPGPPWSPRPPLPRTDHAGSSARARAGPSQTSLHCLVSTIPQGRFSPPIEIEKKPIHFYRRAIIIFPPLISTL